jgi:ATP synthase I chain
MSGEFVGRVSRATLAALGPLAACAAFLGGWPGAVGILAGGLVSLGSFRWIARGVARVAAPGASGGLGASALAVGARHLALFGALAAVLGSGSAHPLALFAGLSVLPPLLIAFGLIDAGRTA